jgi:DNA-binding response OmpR family regulator
MKPISQAPDGRPFRVLVAEDEAIVAMFIEAELGDAGYEVIGAFSTCAEASHWLDSDTPDIALLDHGLKDGPCTDVALELRRRGIPIIALTGSDRGEQPEVFREAPYLGKPIDAALLRVVARILLTSQVPSSSSKADTMASTE